jgi:hypothetical protein
MAATGLLGMNPYRKGVVVDISSKPTALYVDLQNKERARQDALDRYFMEYDKNINPAGMRNVDIDDLTKLSQEAKQFYFQNKKAIQNPMLDGGRAYSQFSAYNKNQLGLVAKSKESAAITKAFQKASQDAQKNGMVVDDDVFQEFNQSQKRVLDPTYQPFDMSRFNAYKPFDPVTYSENIYGKNGENYMKTRVTPTKRGNKELNIELTEFNEENLPTVELIAKANLQNGMRVKDGFARYVIKASQDKSEYDKINTVFKNYYKRDAANLNDIAIGTTLMFSPRKEEEKVGGYTQEARINLYQSTTGSRTPGGASDTEIEPLITDIYIKSPNVSPEMENKLKTAGVNAKGLKDVTNYLPEKYIKLFGDDVPEYVYQDSDKTLWRFDVNNIKNKETGAITSTITNVKQIPFEKYKIDLSGALIGQSGVKGEIPKTNPETPKPPAEKKGKKKVEGF